MRALSLLISSFDLKNPLCCDGFAVGGALSDCLGVVFEDGVNLALDCLAPSVLLECGGVAEGLFKQLGA